MSSEKGWMLGCVVKTETLDTFEGGLTVWMKKKRHCEIGGVS